MLRIPLTQKTPDEALGLSGVVACPGGFEPPTCASVVRRSVHLSYGQIDMQGRVWPVAHPYTHPKME